MTIQENDERFIKTFTPHEQRSARALNASSSEIRRQLRTEIGGARYAAEPGAHDYYVLDEDNTAVPVSMGTWAIWNEREYTKRRSVGKDTWIDPERGEILVSTVFLGLDHAFGGGERALFETMVFWGEVEINNRKFHDDHYQRRYPTYERAREGHAWTVQLTRAYLAGQLTDDEFYNDKGPPARRIRL